jgi:hypothetical protein
MQENLLKELIANKKKPSTQLTSLIMYLLDVINTKGSVPTSDYEILSWVCSDLSDISTLLTQVKGLQKKKGGDVSNASIR